MSQQIKGVLITFESGKITEEGYERFCTLLQEIKGVESVQQIQPIYADLSTAIAEQTVRAELALKLHRLALDVGNFNKMIDDNTMLL